MIPWFFWLFPVAFTLHNIEEALWLPAFSKSAGKFQKPVNTFEYEFAVKYDPKQAEIIIEGHLIFIEPADKLEQVYKD